MKVLVCPDKFKGSLTVDQVCEAMRNGIHRYSSQIEVQTLALADGGEGSLDSLNGLKDAQRIQIEVSDPLFRPVKANYILHGEKAYVEMAQASGLLLLKAEERSPLKTSTYGTGELIKDAIERGAKQVFVMVGGSATNDGGCGMAEALGVSFYKESGELIRQIKGGDLREINRIDASALEGFAKIQFTVLSDVQNPLLGENGASFIYGAQKGANHNDIQVLEQGMLRLCECLNSGKEHVPGSGAAGGLAYGLMSFFEASIQSGIQEIMKILKFEEALHAADFILTGEGKLDSQTLSGKVINGISQMAQKYNIPFGIICGIVEDEKKVQAYLKAKAIMSISDKAPNHNLAMSHAGKYVEELSFDMMRLLT